MYKIRIYKNKIKAPNKTTTFDFRRGLPVDRARHNKKGQPLCMEQYYRLFTSYRVPGIKKDSLISNNSHLLPDPEHIIVICKNQVRHEYNILTIVISNNMLLKSFLNFYCIFSVFCPRCRHQLYTFE